MKTFILAAVAATLVATPALAAPQQYRNDRVVQKNDHVAQKRVVQKRVVQKSVVQKSVRVTPHKTVVTRTVVKGRPAPVQYRNWSKGQRFDSHYARNYRVIQQPRNYRLHDAPRGYRWVQSGNDAVLVGITSGIIGAVIGGILN